MPTVKDIRLALAGKLSPAITDAHVTAYVDTYVLPAVFVFPREAAYDKTMARGDDDWTFIIRALAQNLDRAGQEWLDELCDPAGDRSVKSLLEADQTLNSLARGIRVQSMQDYQEYVFDGRAATYGCEFTVMVEAAGT